MRNGRESFHGRDDEALAKLGAALAPYGRILIVTHVTSDPDAIASSWGMQQLFRKRFGKKCDIVRTGQIVRAENRAMLKILGIRQRPIENVVFSRNTGVFMLDSHPAAGNVALPPGVKPFGIVDHHGQRKIPQSVTFADIRPTYGASAVIVCNYLKAAGVRIGRRLATALFFGIMTDTDRLARHVNDVTRRTAAALFEKTDFRLLKAIEFPPLRIEYFSIMNRALVEARNIGALQIVDLGKVSAADQVSLIAEFMVRFDKVDWTLAMGQTETELLLSIRASGGRKNLGRVMERVLRGIGSGGGHRHAAAGQIKITNRSDEAVSSLKKRIEERLIPIFKIANRKEKKLVENGN